MLLGEVKRALDSKMRSWMGSQWDCSLWRVVHAKVWLVCSAE